jgi:MoxR-like ATPase
MEEQAAPPVDCQQSLHQKWINKEDEFDYMKTLITSRTNLFVYGYTGTGKTEIVRDALICSDIPSIYVDCIDFFNEKLICLIIS